MKGLFYITILLFLFNLDTASAQTCDFFMASTRSGNTVLLATKQITVGNTIGKAVLTKLDASGATIWTSSYNQSEEVQEIIIHENGDDFSYLELHYYGGMRLYKINMQTGALVAQSQLFLNLPYNNQVRVLVRKNEIILVGPNLSEVNGITGGFVVYKINKAALPDSQVVYQGTGTFLGNLIQDSKENILYGYVYNF
ncbi:MAG: hypothetical protein EOO10_23095, partial [Chitinophagaceae bacterium]